MNKGKVIRRPKDRIKSSAAEWVAKKFGVDKNYVYAILRGTFKYGIAAEVKKAYEQKYAELKEILN